MSLGIAVKGSEGIVLAADSRVTITALLQDASNPNVRMHLPVNFDNATKLLTFAKPNNFIGAVTFGDAVIGTTPTDLRTAQSFIPEFEVGLPEDERLTVEDFSKRLSDFFMQHWKDRMPANHQGQGMSFVVGGFDEGKPYGSVYLFEIPKKPTPVEQAQNDFGVTFGGQSELTARILQGYDAEFIKIAQKTLRLTIHQIDDLKKALAPLHLTIPYHLLPLQDCIDLAIFLIKTTTITQNLSIGIRGVGGAIDVAVITQREGLRIIQRKELVAEK